MKKLLLLFVALACILALCACINNTPINTENTQSEEITDTVPDIPKEENQAYYTELDAGGYLGEEFYSPANIADCSEYKIIKSYDEFKALTVYGASFSEKLFDDNYVLAIHRLFDGYTYSDIGFCSFVYENNQASIKLDVYGYEEEDGCDAWDLINYVIIPKNKNTDEAYTKGRISIELNNIESFDIQGFEKSIYSPRDYQNKQTNINEQTIPYYRQIDGGVYFEKIEASNDENGYSIIKTYEEFANTVENYEINKSIFDENYVVAIWWNKCSNGTIGFKNIKCIDNKLYIDLDVSSYYSDFYNIADNSEHDKEIWDAELNHSKIYSYIIVPKSELQACENKSGVIEINKTQIEHIENIIVLDEKYESINEGTSWLITNDREQEALNTLLQESLDFNGEPMLVIYLEEYQKRFYGITEASIINDQAYVTITRNMSEGYDGINEKKIPSLLIVNLPNLDNYSKDGITLNLTINNVESALYRVDKSSVKYTPYELFSADNSGCGWDNTYLKKEPDFNSKVITNYTDLQALFEEYVERDIAEVFNEDIFDESYIFVLYQYEGYCGALSKDFYNLRIAGDGTIYISSVQYLFGGSDTMHHALYFIVVPQNQHLIEHTGVVLEENNDAIVGGPYETHTIYSSSPDFKIEEEYLLFDNYDSVIEFYYQNKGTESSFFADVDFENNYILVFSRRLSSSYGTECYFSNLKITSYGTAYLKFTENGEGNIYDAMVYYTIEFVVIPKSEITEDFSNLIII